jgi:hypothetical protein
MRKMSSTAAEYRARSFACCRSAFSRVPRSASLLGFLLPLAVLLGQPLRRYRLAILFEQAPVTLLAGQPWVDLVELHRLAGDAPLAIETLLDALLTEGIAALPFVVGGEPRLDARSEVVEVG